jgi:hypothetical protein
VSNNQSLATTGGDGWDSVPADSGGTIRGKIIKFSDGHYLVGTESVTGIELVAMDVLTAWVRWAENKPTEHRVTKARERHPDREELGDLDKTKWEIGLNGEQADPWVDSRYLYLANAHDGAEYTFVTSSAGGRKAIGDLKGQIANIRYAHPTAIPVVKLDVEKWKTRFGLKPKPLFRVLDWKRAGGNEPIKQIAPTKLEAFADDAPAYEDMNDEIPF